MNRWAFALCGGGMVLFAALSWSAVRRESPTFDEPYHAASAWAQLHRLDFRIDPEDPPLWKYWLALPNGADALSGNFDSHAWTAQPHDMALEWSWSVTTLYHTPGNDAERFVQRSRAMMLMLGVVLAAAIAAWAGRLGGSVAAVVAAGLYCLDPNFLAHAPLVKNDVAFALSMLLLLWALWRGGQALSWARLGLIALFAGVMLGVKFSGVIAAELVPLMLGIRALLPDPWFALGSWRTTRLSRLRAALAATAVAGVGAYLLLWVWYGARFDPTPTPGLMLDTPTLATMAANAEVVLKHIGAPPAPSDYSATPASHLITGLLWCERHRLLPQAWIAGFLFTYQSTLLRWSFCCGRISARGFWWYFPVAMAVKTPLSTIAAILAGAGAAAVLGRRSEPEVPRRFDRRWAVLCLAIPAALYLAMAMRSNLNIGVRHVLPVYPPLYVAVGCVAGAAWRRWGGVRVGAVLAVLFAGLTVETLSESPDFIPFFNVAAGGERGGLGLLGDSNLDWGQGLKQLHEWQSQHPAVPLYLAYFGFADPQYYGIHYLPLPGGYLYDQTSVWPDRPCVLAVSATHLQGLFIPDSMRRVYAKLAQSKPMLVLGGSIYLYNHPHPPKPPRRLESPGDPNAVVR